MRKAVGSSSVCGCVIAISGMIGFILHGYKELAFVSNESGSMELWTANKDGTSRKQLTNLNANIYHPVWSPDGDYTLPHYELIGC